MTILDRNKLAKTVYAFYLSQKPSQSILVDLNFPIKNNIKITLTRLATFNLTYHSAFQKIMLYLSSYKKITYKSANQDYYCSNPSSVRHNLNQIFSDDYNKYLINNNFSGNFIGRNDL